MSQKVKNKIKLNPKLISTTMLHNDSPYSKGLHKTPKTLQPSPDICKDFIIYIMNSATEWKALVSNQPNHKYSLHIHPIKCKFELARIIIINTYICVEQYEYGNKP